MEPHLTASTERLWTPWRMRYIAGHTKEDGCIFCNRLAADDDVRSLILYRAAHTFVIMNLFPYNTGHVMLVPNQHASDPEELDRATLGEIGELLPLLTRNLRRVFSCAGFNVGLNIGAVAGAGVAEHLHQHIVPRWQGDANFMPILASTMAIPELIPATYAKIRAELHRDLASSDRCKVVLLHADVRSVLTVNDALPTAALEPDTPVWQSAVRALPDTLTNFEITGWAGDRQATPQPGDALAITLRGESTGPLPDGWRFAPIDGDHLASADQATLARALDHLAPAVGPAGTR
jgi:ATP adenylyltransferase